MMQSGTTGTSSFAGQTFEAFVHDMLAVGSVYMLIKLSKHGKFKTWSLS